MDLSKIVDQIEHDEYSYKQEPTEDEEISRFNEFFNKISRVASNYGNAEVHILKMFKEDIKNEWLEKFC